MRVQINDEVAKLVKKVTLDVVSIETRETEENTILTLELKDEITQVSPGQIDPLGKPYVATSKFVQVISDDINVFMKDFKGGKYHGTMKLDVTKPKGTVDRDGNWKWISGSKIQLCSMYLNDFGRANVQNRRDKATEAFKLMFGVLADAVKEDDGATKETAKKQEVEIVAEKIK